MQKVTIGYGATGTNVVSGDDYGTISLNGIYHMMLQPQELPKEQAAWIIPSNYFAADARSHAAQREHGQFSYLVADVDKGGVQLSTLKDVLYEVLGGDHMAMIYSTASSTVEAPRWRVLVPLLNPLRGAEFTGYQEAFFDALEFVGGMVTDRSLAAPGQISFLPIRGEHYEFAATGTLSLDARQYTGLAQRAQQYMDLARLAAEQNTGAARNEGRRSHLAAFRRKHTIEQLLMSYGYAKGPGNNWRSPNQTSNTFATRDMGDGWFSLSQSDADAGLGRPAPGGRYGDQFDLYVHYQCNGNREHAEQYARACLEEEDAVSWGDSSIDHGAQVLETIMRAVSAKDMQLAADAADQVPQLEQDAGNNAEWNLGWPPGLTGELAQWVYLSSGRPIKQFSIAAALYLMTAASRKYNVGGKGLNLYLMLVGGTGVGKGVVKTAADRIIGEVMRKAQDPALGAPFSMEMPVSEAGIRRALTIQNPFTVYEEELGRKLRAKVGPKASSNDETLMNLLTRLYDSGQDTVVGRTIASKEDNSKDAVTMPSVSMVGDTQPDVYNDMLAPDNVSSGFMPRIMPFVFNGNRSYYNEASEQYAVPPEALVHAYAGLLKYVLKSNTTVVHVPVSAEAQELRRVLDHKTTDIMNQHGVDAVRQLYNRAVQNTQRVAAVLAVGVNHLNPVVDAQCWLYAEQLVMQGLQHGQQVLDSGGAGSGLDLHEHEILRAANKYIELQRSPKGHRVLKNHKASNVLLYDHKGVIQRRVLINMVKRLTPFKATANTTPQEMAKRAIAACVDTGSLIEIDKSSLLGVKADGPFYRLSTQTD